MVERISNEKFGQEINKAGLGGLPFSWGADGTINLAPSMTQEQTEAVSKVLRDHVPLTDLERARLHAKAWLRENVKLFFQSKPGGSVRYDADLKMNLLAYAIANQNDPKILAFVKWKTAVQVAYFEQRKKVVDSETIEDIPDVSYDWFEQQFGIEGSVIPDPDIYTEDLML